MIFLSHEFIIEAMKIFDIFSETFDISFKTTDISEETLLCIYRNFALTDYGTITKSAMTGRWSLNPPSYLYP